MSDKREIAAKPQVITPGSVLINILSCEKIDDDLCLQIISSCSCSCPPLPSPLPPSPPSQFVEHYMKPESSLTTL